MEISARLIPYHPGTKGTGEQEDEIFGLWKDRQGLPSVEEQVRSLRKRRKI